MKTVWKKLFMLLLVTMLLVAVAPAAFAATVKCSTDPDHKITVQKNVPATCEKEGWVIYICEECGRVEEHPDALGHDFTGTPDIKLPTCTEDGTKTYTCRNGCGTKDVQAGDPATGHDFSGKQVITPATCTEDKKVTTECVHYGCKEKETVEEPGTALGHDWADDVVKAPTCTEKGSTYHACKVCGEKEVLAETNALGHNYVEKAVTKAPTCTEKGERLLECTNDPKHTKTEEIPATGHTLNSDGICTVCKKGAKPWTMTFHYLDANGNKTSTQVEVHHNDTIPVPSIPKVPSKAFLRWVNEDNKVITSSTVWRTYDSLEVTAVYENDTTDDGLVSLEVWANFYVEGEYHHREKLFVKSFDESNRNTMFTWLYSDEGLEQTREAVFGGGANSTYQWANEVFYNYYGDKAVTPANLKSNGNKAVYIKVTSTKDMEASVMLYVHLKQTETVDRVIPMPGYTAGDIVSRSDVITAVKTKYTGSNMTYSDLYTEDSWDRLMDGQSSSGASSVKVEDNGTTKIHVIVKNATSKSSATKDPSNPATGDNILFVVGTMTVAAVGLAAIVVLKKRKKI